MGMCDNCCMDCIFSRIWWPGEPDISTGVPLTSTSTSNQPPAGIQSLENSINPDVIQIMRDIRDAGEVAGRYLDDNTEELGRVSPEDSKIILTLRSIS